MNDGVYFDQNGNEVIVINGFEYSREEFGYVWRLQYVIKKKEMSKTTIYYLFLIAMYMLLG